MEEGGGFELAKKLDKEGVWRQWLGPTLYSSFSPSLSSPSSFSSFLSLPLSDVRLQLRVRSLLFDKSLFPVSTPDYLHLHADDVYYTLDHASPPPRDSKVPSQRFRLEDFPDTWYNQFMDNYRATRPYILSSSIRESDKRSPAGMSNYLRLLERHKRRRLDYKEDGIIQPNAMLVDDTPAIDDTVFFPETMFMMNCVPDSVVPPTSSVDGNKKVDFNGVLDTLPKVVTKSSSSIMLERLGIRPDYLSVEQGPDGNRRQLGQEQALQMSKKIVARVLTNVGFEGATEIPIEVLSQFLSCHISKLGRILKVLADSYRKQCSATELIKIFLQAGGHSLSSLAEYVKDARPVVPQAPQQIQSPQSQLASLQHNTLQLPQQVPRQMHTQMPHMVHPNNMTQQQLELFRRRQASSPHTIMSMDNNRPMVEVKLENPPDLPMDSNTLSAINSRAQLQWRQQQQIAALQRFGHQTRQPTSMQIPNVGAVRAQPVKVEGFQELMGGDTSLKQNADENKLASPSSR